MTSPSIRPEKIEEQIKRLRADIVMYGEHEREVWRVPAKPLDIEAADLIESLKAENDGLRKHLEKGIDLVAGSYEFNQRFTGAREFVSAARAFLTAREDDHGQS